MILFPNAKINIGLHVTDKRTDGYHCIETIFYPVNLCDILEIVPAGKDLSSGLKVTGLTVETGENNICLKAYNHLSSQKPLPALRLHLHKIIPPGSGLGGGSSDAAFTIMALNRMFGLEMNKPDMEKLAAKTGSDTPFFIENKPVYASGRGDIFSKIKISLSGTYIVIVHPGIKIDTGWAYSLIKPKHPGVSLKDLIGMPLENWQDNIVNDFEKPIFNNYPQVKKVKDVLLEKGALYASMSGSGSACYGFFEKSAAEYVRSSLPEYFIWEGFLK